MDLPAHGALCSTQRVPPTPNALCLQAAIAVSAALRAGDADADKPSQVLHFDPARIAHRFRKPPKKQVRHAVLCTPGLAVPLYVHSAQHFCPLFLDQRRIKAPGILSCSL